MKKLFIIGMLLLPSLVLANEKLEYELKVLGSEYGYASLYFTDTKAYGEIKANKKWSSVYNVNNQIATMVNEKGYPCLLYTSPSPRDRQKSRMPSSA